jgi:hypothetical protein
MQVSLSIYICSICQQIVLKCILRRIWGRQLREFRYPLQGHCGETIGYSMPQQFSLPGGSLWGASGDTEKMVRGWQMGWNLPRYRDNGAHHLIKQNSVYLSQRLVTCTYAQCWLIHALCVIPHTVLLRLERFMEIEQFVRAKYFLVFSYPLSTCHEPELIHLANSLQMRWQLCFITTPSSGKLRDGLECCADTRLETRMEARIMRVSRCT